MKTKKNIMENTGITIGLATSLFLIAYFSIMKMLNLAHIPELRYFNFFILLAGIYLAYQYVHKPNKAIEYLPGLGLGFITTVCSVIPFAIFMFVYFSYLDPVLLEQIKSSQTTMREYLTPGSVAGAIVIEGMSSGVILSFIMMQYYKEGFERGERKQWKHKDGEFIARSVGKYPH